MKKGRRILYAMLILSLSMSSCLVSKKKYDALQRSKTREEAKNKELTTINTEQSAKIKSLEVTAKALSSSLQNTREEYNDMKNMLAESNAKKTTQIDSLSSKVSNLSTDNKTLALDLKTAIANYESEKNRMLTLQSQLTDKKSDADKLRAELEVKQQRLNELEKMIAANQKQVEALRKTLTESLQAFEGQGVSVSLQDGKVYISLDEKLLFKIGSATVGAEGVNALKELAGVLEKNKTVGITIEGHTDNTGGAKVNWELSVKRATAILTILQDNSEIEPARFTASGRGMYHPIDSADTDEARTKNRRTEIILTPKLQELYDILNEQEQ